MNSLHALPLATQLPSLYNMEGQAGPSGMEGIADATSQSMQVTPQPGPAVNAATSSSSAADKVKYEDMTSKDYCAYSYTYDSVLVVTDV